MTSSQGTAACGIAFALVVGSLSACNFRAASDFQASLTGQNASTATPAPASSASASPSASPSGAGGSSDRFRFFIRGKKTSNLSDDRKTITLSIDATDPDGGDVSVQWTYDQSMASLNADKGKDVQLSVRREGSFNLVVTASVKGSLKADDPDVATFVVPVENGKIKVSEIPPEITLSPQSLVLFRSLPSTLALSDDQLMNLGVKTRTQLTATSFIYDATTNTKVKTSADNREIKWLSDDPAIAVVDDNGFVRPADGSRTGTSFVSASSKTNSSSKAAAMVKVAYLDTKITLSYPTTTIFLTGKGSPSSVTIGATVQYTNPDDRGRVIFTDPNGREITWSTSDPSIAQVNSSGTLAPLADASTGDVIVTAASNYDPSRVATVSIKIRAENPTSVTFLAQ